MRIELKNVLFTAASMQPGNEPSYSVTGEANGFAVWKTTRHEEPPLSDVYFEQTLTKWFEHGDRDEAIEFAVAQRDADGA